MIELRELYGEVNGVLIGKLTKKLKNGSIYGVYGAKGEGSLLLSLLAGVYKPLSGTVLLNGLDVWKTPAEARRQMGYFPADNGLYPSLTATEYLLMLADLQGLSYEKSIRRTHEILEWAELTDKKDRLISRLSPLEQKLLGIGGTLLGNADILLLDGVLKSLNARNEQEVLAAIKSLPPQKTIFLSDTRLSVLQEVCDEVLLLSESQEVTTAVPNVPSRTSVKKSRWAILTQKNDEYETIDDSSPKETEVQK